jgi:hypothetical protein
MHLGRLVVSTAINRPVLLINDKLLIGTILVYFVGKKLFYGKSAPTINTNTSIGPVLCLQPETFVISLLPLKV